MTVAVHQDGPADQGLQPPQEPIAVIAGEGEQRALFGARGVVLDIAKSGVNDRLQIDARALGAPLWTA
jgi:hypothetical protein